MELVMSVNLQGPFSANVLKKDFLVKYLKLVSAIFYQTFIISPNDSPLKTVKNAYFI